MADTRIEARGLSRVEQIYQERSLRAKELRAEGKNIIGYFCVYPPVEMLTAAGLVPYRILGSPRKPIVKADAYLEGITCSFVRSCFDAALEGDYDFLDGLIVPSSCDHMLKIYGIWQYHFKPRFSYFVDVPNTTSAPSLKFFKASLGTFKKRLEEFTGSEITDQRLAEAIRLHNRNRALMREIYSLRKPDPPLLSASEMSRILLAAQSLPVEESSQLLVDVFKDIKERGAGPVQTRARIMVYGPEIDDSPIFELIEESGANVVIDDICPGTRNYWSDVEVEGDPMDNLAIRYLEKITCPRTVKHEVWSHKDDLERRFGHLLSLVRDFRVNGVILYIIRFCDNFAFDVPELKAYLEQAGLPMLHFEDEYTGMSSGRMRTRIEAFLEMIG